MPGARPLTVMLTVLGWAAIPAWPAGIASAVLWTFRAEVLLLSLAGAGTSSALTLLLVGAARERTARYERLIAARATEYERLEELLVGAVADLGSRWPRRPGPRAGRPAGAPAPR